MKYNQHLLVIRGHPSKRTMRHPRRYFIQNLLNKHLQVLDVHEWCSLSHEMRYKYIYLQHLQLK